jgi:hypothetical protein
VKERNRIRTGVNDGREASSERRRGVGDRRNSNPPVVREGTACERWGVRDGAAVLGRVGATKGKLSVVGVGGATRRRKVHAEDLGGDGALRVQVVKECRHQIRVRDGALSEVVWADAENAIDTAEARGCGGDTDRLRCDGEAGVRDL